MFFLCMFFKRAVVLKHFRVIDRSKRNNETLKPKFPEANWTVTPCLMDKYLNIWYRFRAAYAMLRSQYTYQLKEQSFLK